MSCPAALCLNPECLRYYLAAKLSGGIDDLDLNLEDFAQRVNSDLVGKVVNIASRCAGFIGKGFDGMLAAQPDNPELLAEPIQTIMRVYDEENPYEKLKSLTRGRSINREVLDRFVDSLERVPDKFKDKLKELTVETYTGLAANLVDLYFKQIKDGE